MTFLYLDTSALLKRYVDEAGSDAVIALMAEAEAVVTSLVTRAEVPAAIAKAVRRRVLDDDRAQRAHGRFLKEWPNFGKVPVTDALVARADTLTWEHGLRAYDAIQLAAALSCLETIDALGADILFATFDRQLSRRCCAGPDWRRGRSESPDTGSLGVREGPSSSHKACGGMLSAARSSRSPSGLLRLLHGVASEEPSERRPRNPGGRRCDAGRIQGEGG